MPRRSPVSLKDASVAIDMIGYARTLRIAQRKIFSTGNCGGPCDPRSAARRRLSRLIMLGRIKGRDSLIRLLNPFILPPPNHSAELSIGASHGFRFHPT